MKPLLLLLFLPTLDAIFSYNFLDTTFQPIYHTPGIGSIGYSGDPNGMMYRSDTQLYHMFWQCKYDVYTSPTYWCHAVSEDMAKWTRLPVNTAMSFSGGATQLDSGDIKMMYKDVTKNAGFYTASPDNITDPNLKVWKEAENATAFSGATDPSDGWKNPHGGYYAVAGEPNSAHLWTSDDNFENWVDTGTDLTTFTWDRADSTPRDPNFWEDVSSNLFVFEGGMKMNYFSGADFYSIGSYNSDAGTFEPLEGYYQPLDFGGELWASETFMNENKNAITSIWILEGDCKIESWPPPCEYLTDRGWFGIHSLPRKSKVETRGEWKRLSFEPVEGLANLRIGEIEQITVNKKTLMTTKSKSYELELTLGEGVEAVEATVLASPGGEEGTRVGLKAADMFGGELITNKVRIFVDVSVVEVFSGGNVVTARVYPKRGDSTGIAIEVTGGEGDVKAELNVMGSAF
ncbi:hypothetical protein TL16_g06859 [Triparma laevis f. inornata]|uniref:Uncharacterized protein n=1 Tax=Triparma laevis f. inornata TaxID=1714386 RepID=A0A9W7AXJ6_9STRA|nr:hypothetical protein TL16_g06859 [Triparma laevis f. inornata]